MGVQLYELGASRMTRDRLLGKALGSQGEKSGFPAPDDGSSPKRSQ